MDGVVSPRTEGTPQGSPLSPLLELDKELQTRSHRFVRYADDCSIYIRSEKSAHRVMETITDYIESKLKLKVNRTKSKVSRPNESTLLGFSFYRSKNGWEIRIAPKSLKKIKEKMNKKTKRNDPAGTKEKIKKMEAVIRGWVNYFWIAKAKSKMKELDEMIRTRLRIGIWKQWKKPKTKRVNLEKSIRVEQQQQRLFSNSPQPCTMSYIKQCIFCSTAIRWIYQLLLLENGTPSKIILTNRRDTRPVRPVV